MNALKRLMAVMLVGGAGFGLFVACGGNNETSCTFDADCADGEACEGTVCVPTCTTAADCLEGEVCAAGVNTELLVCQAAPDPNNTTGNNTTNNTTGNNTTNTQYYYTVAITSTTTETDACDPAVADPGPDIFGVGLEDQTGAQLGWGIVEYDGVQFDGNDEVDTGVIDGAAPTTGADGCPDMFSGNVVALGCVGSAEGSFIIVSFQDASGNPIALDATANQSIRVYEYGGVCSTGSTDDTYNLDICTDTDASKGGDASSCTISLLIDAAGEQSGDVSGF